MAQASLEQGGRVPLRYGGFWRRVVAALIDGILIGLVLYAIDMFLPIVENASMGSISPPDSAMGIAAEANLTPLGTLILIIGSWLYAALLESGPGQATIGKLAMALKVTDIEGDRVSFAQASGRYYAKFISFVIFLIGFLMVAFTARKQGLHDLLAKTLVIRRS